MQIQLKQTEIVAALTGYLAQQGIAVAHKKIDISFTAGRKNTGLLAEVSIEDGDIPGFTDAEGDVVDTKVVPILSVVDGSNGIGLAAETKLTTIDVGIAAPAVLVAEPEVVGPEPVDEDHLVPDEPAPKVTNSLFS